MEWQDEAVVLAKRAHGETSAIIELLTQGHGRHLGLVRGARGLGGTAQPGSSVRAIWRGRLAEHLGHYRLEPVKVRTAAFLESPAALAAVRSVCALAVATLPERDPHGELYAATNALLDSIAGNAGWPVELVRWELGLIEALGFGLDLTCCAVTGSTRDLAYVSPKTGRAVTTAAGAPYKDRLLDLPRFLWHAEENTAEAADIAAGLALTAFFLEQFVLAPHHRSLPAARLALGELFRPLA